MIEALQECWEDLERQRDKILAVYDASEVTRAADRLGDTLKRVFVVVGDMEKAYRMFGKKKGFGKRVQALVHDIGTNSNAVLAAVSLAIADRPHMLYMMDEAPDHKKEELLNKCLEADRHYYGRGEKVDHEKAYDSYLWAAERGLPEAMFMVAWMFRHGVHVQQDQERCMHWLELAVKKDYIPAVNELGVILLDDADKLEKRYPLLQEATRQVSNVPDKATWFSLTWDGSITRRDCTCPRWLLQQRRSLTMLMMMMLQQLTCGHTSTGSQVRWRPNTKASPPTAGGLWIYLQRQPKLGTLRP
ncbi:unnamed protein product [Chrysoparadoxa australica]